MSCLDNTDILRIVGGNSFQIAITVKARRVADGSEIEDFDLSASSPVLNLIHAGEKTRKYFVTQGNQAIISFDGSEGLGYYGMEMSGSYGSEAWRFCIEKVLQLVDTNAKANIPEWSVLVDDTYFIEGTISIYGGGGGGDTVQADWTETNPTSAAFILHKPDLSVYATKTEVASGLAGKQDTIVDLTSIRYGAAAGATAYQKPASGIPESDMSEGVQTSLDKADSAYQKPSSGIPATDMSEGVQASLAKANSAVQTETDPVFSGSPAAEITQADINGWNAKQPAIADLAAIREGAAAGATAVQPDEMAQAIDGVDGDIADINAKIPSAASSLNQLADKAYVNSSIATNSATYRGSFNLITDLGMNVDATHAQISGALATAITTADNNDYAFVQIPDSASTPTVIAKIERYKHNGSGWVYEYDLNNSGFTSAQWAAINSGITSGLVGKLADLPNNSELATLLNGKQNVINDLSAIRSGASAGATAVQPADLTEALNDVEDEIAGLDEGKQDTIEDLSTIRSGAAAGATAYQKPASGIPESDMSDGVQTSLGKADSAYQKPSSGIPATDMSEGVQASLEKANSAVQTETDPVFSGSPAAEITQADINNWNAKQPAIADLADIREGAAAGATAVQPDEMAQAIDEVDGDIGAINAKIPTAASNLNQLADKAYVNSSIATNSATYRGSFNLITDLGMNVDATHAQIAGALATAIVTADNNDYAFVQIPDSASTPTVIAKIERYKHNGSGWVYEYDLNNSGFTAAQWAAINSGITSGLVGKLADLPNNSELATLLNGKQNIISDLSAIRSGASAGATAIQPADLTEALNGVEAEIAGLDESKQDTIEDLSTIRSGAAAGATAYQKPVSGIPESDMSSAVQQELSKANTAVQTETDPIFSASPAAGITAQNIQTWNGEPAARQAADTALQNSVSTLQTDLAAEVTARATADALLQQQYNALTQSDIIVGALPATGVPNVIYRVPGTTDFTDYMWYDGQFVPMATYGLPISAEFVVDENLNKTQEEVNLNNIYALVYKGINDVYNAPTVDPSRIVASSVPISGISKYQIVLEDVIVPSGNYLAIKLMDANNIGYFSKSSRVVRTINRYITGASKWDIELSDEELNSVKAIMVGLYTADTNQPTCSFTLSVFAKTALRSDIDDLEVILSERFPITTSNIDNGAVTEEKLSPSVNDTLERAIVYKLYDETVSEYLQDRLKIMLPVNNTQKKYHIDVQNVYAGNMSIRLMNTTNIAYWGSDYGVRTLFIGGYASVSLDIELTDEELEVVKSIGVGQVNADTSHTSGRSFSVQLYNNDDNSIGKQTRILSSKFPIGTESIQDFAVTEQKLNAAFVNKVSEYAVESVTSQYYTDNRAKVKIATVGLSKYHVDVTDIVGISNQNPLVVRLYNSTNMAYWGGAYNVRTIGTYYDTSNISLDIELTAEELETVKAVGVGMRDAIAEQPECVFNVTLYPNYDNSIGKQTRVNSEKIGQNSEKIGDLSSLSTYEKSSLVVAINEIVEEGVAGGTSVDEIPWNDTFYCPSKKVFQRIYNPYKDGGSNQFVGQLHDHSQSEDDAKKNSYFAYHKTKGYDFLALTDYGTGSNKLYNGAPADWNAADLPQDFVMLGRAYENAIPTAPGQSSSTHLIVLNAYDVVDLYTEQICQPLQKTVNQIVTNNNIVSLAHPYWKNTYKSVDELKSVTKNLRFVEIYTGLEDYTEAGGDITASAIRYGFSIGNPVNWDYAFETLLSNGNFVFGVAVSDFHAVYTGDNINSSTIAGMGCVKVFANTGARSNILDALLKGNFYSSTGVETSINSVSCSDGVFTVDVGVAGATVKFISKNGTILQTTNTTSGQTSVSYTFTGQEKGYVRAVVDFNEKTLNWEGRVSLTNKTVWTNAIFIDEIIL